jgi:hypothetical protein
MPLPDDVLPPELELPPLGAAVPLVLPPLGPALACGPPPALA